MIYLVLGENPRLVVYPALMFVSVCCCGDPCCGDPGCGDTVLPACATGSNDFLSTTVFAEQLYSYFEIVGSWRCSTRQYSDWLQTQVRSAWSDSDTEVQLWYSDAPNGDAFGQYDVVARGPGVTNSTNYIRMTKKEANIDQQVGVSFFLVVACTIVGCQQLARRAAVPGVPVAVAGV